MKRRIGAALAGVVCALSSAVDAVADSTARFRLEVIERIPHDPSAFVQGFELHGETLYVGTGRYGESTVRAVDAATGRLLRIFELPQSLFGEGITVLNGKLFQLSWKSNLGFVYSAGDLALEGFFAYDHEGWGIANDGRRLIVSDGTATLRFYDPRSFELIDSIEVTDGDVAVTDLNELEYIEGRIYANVWQSNDIVVIDPASGRVDARIDATGLVESVARESAIGVLNGIAWDPGRRELLVTGKNWPAYFRVLAVPADH